MVDETSQDDDHDGLPEKLPKRGDGDGVEHDLAEVAIGAGRVGASMAETEDGFSKAPHSAEQDGDSDEESDPEVQKALAADEILMSLRDWRAHLEQQELPGKEELLRSLETSISDRNTEITQQVQAERTRRREFIENIVKRILSQATQKIVEFSKSKERSLDVFYIANARDSEEFILKAFGDGENEIKLSLGQIMEIRELFYRFMGGKTPSEEEASYQPNLPGQGTGGIYRTENKQKTFFPNVEIVEIRRRDLKSEIMSQEKIKESKLIAISLELKRIEVSST